MKPWRVFGYYALPVALLAGLLALFAGLGAKLTSGASPLTSPDTLPTGIMVQPGAILGGQALRIGEAITPGTSPATSPVGGLQRPVGSFAYARDGATAFVKTGVLATDWSAFGASTPATKTDALNTRAAGLMGGAGITCFHEDYLYGDVIASYTAGLGGSATLSLDSSAVGGMLVMATGATTGSTARFITAGTMIGRPDTNRFYIGFRSTYTTAPNATTQFEHGVSNNIYGSTLGIGVCGVQSTTNYVVIYDSAATCNGTRVTTTTAVDGFAHYFETWTVADGKVHFAIDQTEIAGSPFTMATSPTVSLRAYAEINNLTTAANQATKLDYFHLCWNESP
jgi:hypothetical protein